MAFVFVYGRLRRGEDHHTVLTGATFLGFAWTAPRYALLIVGSSPALARGGTKQVRGELYSVTDEHLARLDRLAGPGLLDRDEIELENGRLVSSYVVPEHHTHNTSEIPGGDWVAWRRRE